MKKSKPGATKPAPVPTSDQPGELPPDSSPSSKTAYEKQTEWEEGRILGMLRKELGGTGFVTLQRRHPGSGQLTYAHLGGSMPVEQFTIGNVAATYGGGDFIGKARPANGQFAHEFRFTVDHTIAPKNPMGPAPVERQEKQPALDVPALVREIRDATKPDQSGMFELMKVAIARPEPKGETAAILETLKEIREEARRSEDRFLKLIERMDSRQPAAAPTLREQLEEAKELMEMIGGGGKAEKEESFWKEIGKGIAEVAGPILKQHFAGGGGPVIPGVRVASPLTPTHQIPPPASLIPRPAGTGPASQQQPINVTPAPAGPENGTAQPEDMNAILNMAMRQFHTAALEAAEKKTDVYEFVAGVLTMAPKMYHGQIFETANADDWFVRIFGNDPAAVKHAVYIGTIRNALLEKALIAHAQKSAAAGAAPQDTARAFLDWNTREVDDHLLGLAEDREEWGAAFDGVTLDVAWLEALRNAIGHQLGEPAGKVVAIEPAAAKPAKTK